MQPGYFSASCYSLVFHVLLLVSLSFSFGWRHITDASAPTTLALQANVVDESMIEAELAKLEAADQRIREAEERRRLELQTQAEQARAARLEEEGRLASLSQEREATEQRLQAEAQNREVEKRERIAREEREAADRRAREEAEKQRLVELEEARKKEEQRLAALAEQRREEELVRQQAREKADQAARERARQAELEEQLKRAMAEETSRQEAEEAGLLDEYRTLISQRIVRNWIQPPGAVTGLRCELQLTQIPGGEIIDLKIVSCNGDTAVVQSIERAVQKASPLPPPRDPRLFERKVTVIFEPDN